MVTVPTFQPSSLQPWLLVCSWVDVPELETLSLICPLSLQVSSMSETTASMSTTWTRGTRIWMGLEISVITAPWNTIQIDQVGGLLSESFSKVGIALKK